MCLCLPCAYFSASLDMRVSIYVCMCARALSYTICAHGIGTHNTNSLHTMAIVLNTQIIQDTLPLRRTNREKSPDKCYQLNLRLKASNLAAEHLPSVCVCVCHTYLCTIVSGSGVHINLILLGTFPPSLNLSLFYAASAFDKQSTYATNDCVCVCMCLCEVCPLA